MHYWQSTVFDRRASGLFRGLEGGQCALLDKESK